jgi:hypothetical protein
MARTDSEREQADVYVRAMAQAMQEMDASPVCLIAIDETGPISICASEFPTDAMPTLEEWNKLWPGHKSNTGFVLPVRTGDVDGH